MTQACSSGDLGRLEGIQHLDVTSIVRPATRLQSNVKHIEPFQLVDKTLKALAALPFTAFWVLHRADDNKVRQVVAGDGADDLPVGWGISPTSNPR